MWGMCSCERKSDAIREKLKPNPPPTNARPLVQRVSITTPAFREQSWPKHPSLQYECPVVPSHHCGCAAHPGSGRDPVVSPSDRRGADAS